MNLLSELMEQSMFNSSTNFMWIALVLKKVQQLDLFNLARLCLIEIGSVLLNDEIKTFLNLNEYFNRLNVF